jgi:hypothetical protein
MYSVASRRLNERGGRKGSLLKLSGYRAIQRVYWTAVQATTARLTVEQFRTSVDQNKQVINVLPEHDKIRMQHCYPLHPQVVDALSPLPGSQQDSEPIFKQLSFERWLKHQNIQLLNSNAHFVPGDLRKFCEQHGDVLQWDQSNKNYILSTGFLGSIDDFTSTDCLKTCMICIYIKYWKDVRCVL